MASNPSWTRFPAAAHREDLSGDGYDLIVLGPPFENEENIEDLPADEERPWEYRIRIQQSFKGNAKTIEEAKQKAIFSLEIWFEGVRQILTKAKPPKKSTKGKILAEEICQWLEETYDEEGVHREFGDMMDRDTIIAAIRECRTRISE
jgi:hypothetical protein